MSVALLHFAIVMSQSIMHCAPHLTSIWLNAQCDGHLEMIISFFVVIFFYIGANYVFKLGTNVCP